jgi:hypothetical protein
MIIGGIILSRISYWTIEELEELLFNVDVELRKEITTCNNIALTKMRKIIENEINSLKENYVNAKSI